MYIHALVSTSYLKKKMKIFIQLGLKWQGLSFYKYVHIQWCTYVKKSRDAKMWQRSSSASPPPKKKKKKKNRLPTIHIQLSCIIPFLNLITGWSLFNVWWKLTTESVETCTLISLQHLDWSSPQLHLASQWQYIVWSDPNAGFSLEWTFLLPLTNTNF